MSKSTPLSSLPNVKSQAYDERENQLVKEILNEIDGNDQQSNSQQQQAEMQQQQQQPNLQKQQSNLQQQQPSNEQAYEQNQQHMMEQQMMEQQMMEQQMNEQIDQGSNESLDKSDDMVSNIINLVKQPLIVAIVAIMISLPQISSILDKVISSNAMLLSYSTVIILLLKGIMAGGLYFTINKSL